MDYIREILKLKRAKNAVILVHNYQRPEIYEIGDFIGDSLDLAKKASKTDAEIIVFCGVLFMAESAKILNPQKKVLLPVLSAGCPMADMITAEGLIKLKEQYPKATIVTYVNSSAEVKAVSDECCTSANAINVVESVKNDQIIFTPDQNLAAYIQSKTSKKIIPWQGYCPVHHDIYADSILEAKKNYPNAAVLVHPESRMDAIALADHVCSTSQMITTSKKSNANEFIVATEQGMIERLQKEVPHKKFYPVGGVCFNMKKITLKSVFESLLKSKHEIEVSEDIRKNAEIALKKMIGIQ